MVVMGTLHGQDSDGESHQESPIQSKHGVREAKKVQLGLKDGGMSLVAMLIRLSELGAVIEGEQHPWDELAADGARQRVAPLTPLV